jgi:hypothetical protein
MTETAPIPDEVREAAYRRLVDAEMMLDNYRDEDHDDPDLLAAINDTITICSFILQANPVGGGSP